MRTLRASTSSASRGKLSRPSRLRQELANQIVGLLRQCGAGVGYRLVEGDLCNRFSVSRTPVRAALALLAETGLLEARHNRGFLVKRPLRDDDGPPTKVDSENDETRLFLAIARDRMTGTLPMRCSQRELVRRYDVQPVIKVLRDLAKFGVVQRQPGHGWSFLPTIDSPAAHDESYRLRIIVEPAAILEPDFKLDPAWITEMRQRHERFLHAPWKDAMSIEFFHMNAQFHVGIASASGNRYIASLVEQHNQLRRFLNYNWTYGADRVKVSAQEHLELLQVLERGDQELASLLLRRHLDDARLLTPPVATEGSER